MLDNLERKWGKYTIPHLMRYIVFGNALIYLIQMIFPQIVYYLNLMPDRILRGEVWRLVTFLFVPSIGNLLMTALSLFCYYWIGEALERTIGSFRFGMYYLIGWAAIILVSFLLYFLRIFNIGYLYNQMSFFNQTLFIALATLHPNIQILLFYFLPVKAKWAGVFSGVIILIEFFTSAFPIKMLILASFLPYLVYFLPMLIQRFKAEKRRKEFEKKINGTWNEPVNQGKGGNGIHIQVVNPSAVNKNGSEDRKVRKVAFHRCTVCGITEQDDPNMIFRYCSTCNGNHEYCEQHIHNHTHI